MKSHPKRKRPISTKNDIHLVMKSSFARGVYSLRSHRNLIRTRELVNDLAARFKIKVSRYENVGNHLHLLIRVPSHSAYNSFVRGLSSAIARHVLGLSKRTKYSDTDFKSLNENKTFWDSRPFTRIVTWGRDRLALMRYLNLNRIQAIGFSVFVSEQEGGYRLSG